MFSASLFTEQNLSRCKDKLTQNNIEPAKRKYRKIDNAEYKLVNPAVSSTNRRRAREDTNWLAVGDGSDWRVGGGDRC